MKQNNKKWCVYKHTSPSGKCYIGITSKKNPSYRWGKNGSRYLLKNNGKFMQTKFANAILKYGWRNFQHEILFNNLEEQQAKLLEVSLIRYFKNKKLSYNITDGGDGHNGAYFKHTEEAKEKIRLHHRHFQTEETKRKISKVQTGVKHPEWRKQIMRKVYADKTIPVVQLTKDGVVVQEFNSIMDACRSTGIRSGNICNAIKWNICAGGYRWIKKDLYKK